MRQRDSYRLLLEHLADAMGLSLAALVGCGGNVVVDQLGTSGAGGATSTSTSPASSNASTSSTTTSTGSGFSCMMQPGVQLQYACLPLSTPCPTGADPKLASELSLVLGLCDNSSLQCCNKPSVFGAACGPDPTNSGACCYYAAVGPAPCMGRPLVVAGRARTAGLRRRDAFRDVPGGPSSGLDGDTRRAIAAAWTQDALFEHASVAAFARFALELLAVGAPAEHVRGAQRAMGDEIVHAELCFALAGRFGATPSDPGPLDVGGLTLRTNLAELAAATAREGCVGETIAALIAAEARDSAVDPAVRAALDIIARDEASHAAFAWRFVAWALRAGDAEVRAAVARELGHVETVSLPDEVEPANPDAYRASGRLPPRDVRNVTARAVAEVIRPSAVALLRELAV